MSVTRPTFTFFAGCVEPELEPVAGLEDFPPQPAATASTAAATAAPPNARAMTPPEVLDLQAKTDARSYQPPQRRACRARRRPACSRRRAPAPALAAGARAVPRRVVAPRRHAPPRGDARALDPAPPRDEGRRPRGRTPRAARDPERPRAGARRVAARDRLPRARADRRRSRGTGRHGLARRGRAARDGVRPRHDRARGPGAAPGQALVHERLLRARAGHLHALGAAPDLRGRARLSRVGDEPPARPAATRRAGADRRAPRPGSRGR